MWHRGLSCSLPCGIFLDQGLNSSLLDWQVVSLPLRHQGKLPPPPAPVTIAKHKCPPTISAGASSSPSLSQEVGNLTTGISPHFVQLAVRGHFTQMLPASVQWRCNLSIFGFFSIVHYFLISYGPYQKDLL